MARKRRAECRVVLQDAKYGHVVLAKFINSLMYRGKKPQAEKIVYGAMDDIAEKLDIRDDDQSLVEKFEKIISNVRPLVEVRSRRIGGATYQVPVEVDPRRGMAQAMRWILKAARSRSGRSMREKLSAEFMDALHGKGAAIKRRDDMHKMAEANRAFAHYK